MSTRVALVIAIVLMVLLVPLVACAGAASAKPTTTVVDIPVGSMKQWWFDLQSMDTLKYDVEVLYGTLVDVLFATYIALPMVLAIEGEPHYGVHDYSGQLGGFEGRICLVVDNSDSIGGKATGAVRVQVLYEHSSPELILWAIAIIIIILFVAVVATRRRLQARKDRLRARMPIEVVDVEASEDESSLALARETDKFAARYCDSCGRMMHPDPATGDFSCDECGHPAVAPGQAGGTPSGGIGAMAVAERFEVRDEACGRCGAKLLYDRELKRLYCPACMSSPPRAP